MRNLNSSSHRSSCINFHPRNSSSLIAKGSGGVAQPVQPEHHFLENVVAQAGAEQQRAHTVFAHATGADPMFAQGESEGRGAVHTLLLELGDADPFEGVLLT